MASSHPYPVFFECPGLEGDHLRKLENYFQIRRKSGGGDCGPVTNVNEKVYSVAFKEQEAQQRVLQRKEHVVELPRSSLVLTVLGPHGSSSFTSSTPDLSVNAKQDFSSFKKQQSKPASDTPPSGEEYELQLDGYLLSYLKECHQAGKELEDELASMSCSAQLYPDEGRVLLRRLTQPVSVEDGSNWKADVDKLFDRYLCHYEVNPCSIKALLQSCSSDQITDGVKVYTEGAVAVVVGKHSQVKARLTDMEDLTVKHRESRLSEKKTRSRRLGGAKLRLLWKEIERDLGQNFPDVKVTQGDSGQVVLEGSAEDILEAGDWISEKEKLVSEMTVPNMSPHLLAFLRKAYEGPEMLRDFLGVGDEVEVELRDTELRLFSLSADKLDDAEKKGQEKFKEVNIDVPTCSNVPPELREKLKFMTNKMNQGQHRADVLFGSDSTICLLGHTKDVEELNETVIEFILDQSSIQGKVTLPYPELVQHLPELLQLHKFDYSGVTLHPLTSSSGPLVMLEGASSKVTEVKTRLGQFLDSLVQGRVAINLPGAMCYFESPSGRENILNVALSHKCLIQLQEQPHSKNRQHLASGVTLNNGVRMVASYRLCDGLQVLVCQGDITKQEADALVNAANEDLDHGGGVAAALRKAGGPDVQRESKMMVKHSGKILTGDVVVTTGGNLKCKKLLHAVGPRAGKPRDEERFLLEKTVRSALNLAERLRYKSIALPCISSGLFGVPIPVCTEAIVTAVKQFGSQGGRSLNTIILIDNRGEVVKAMQEACDRLFQGISTINSTPSGNTTGHITRSRDMGLQMNTDAQHTSRGASAGAPGNSVHVDIVQGTIETQQVDALVSPMINCEPCSTRVGGILSTKVGPQFTARFRKEAEDAVMPGDLVLLENLPRLPSKAVFFLNLARWDGDPEGTAAEVLRMGIDEILTSCERRGFGSVAFPVLGAGIALGFPNSVVASAFKKAVQGFQQNRTRGTPFLIRIVIHPSDTEAREVFDRFTKDVSQPDQETTTYRIVMLGKTGSGKSSLASTIFGEKDLFPADNSPNSGTAECQTETRFIDGRNITLTDTPGFFDTGRSEEDTKREILKCITECAPGPHAFLIVLKVEKFTEQERAVIDKICQNFSEEALKYAVIIFTHGDQLRGGMKIEEFVSKSRPLSDLVKKCGGRCHVFDNEHWTTNQVPDLLNTIDKMVKENNGSFYTNEMLQAVNEHVEREIEHIKQSSGNLSQQEIRQQANIKVSDRLWTQLAGTATGLLLGAFLGIQVNIVSMIPNFKNLMKFLPFSPSVPIAAVGAVTGGVAGGFVGHEAAKNAESPLEAAQMAAKDVWKKRNNLIEHAVKSQLEN